MKMTNLESYYKGRKGISAPGALIGTLAADMNQGGKLDRGQPSFNLTTNLGNPGARMGNPPAVTARLSKLMRQG